MNFNLHAEIVDVYRAIEDSLNCQQWDNNAVFVLLDMIQRNFVGLL